MPRVLLSVQNIQNSYIWNEERSTRGLTVSASFYYCFGSAHKCVKIVSAVDQSIKLFQNIFQGSYTTVHRKSHFYFQPMMLVSMRMNRNFY